MSQAPPIIEWLRRCLTGDLAYDGQEFVSLLRGDAEQLLAYLEDPSNSCWECSGSKCELQGLCGFHAHELLEERDRRIVDVMAGCDIERNGRLYRQVEVVLGTGLTTTEVEVEQLLRDLERRRQASQTLLSQLELEKARAENLRAEERSLQREVDRIRALRDIPIQLTWEEMAALYRRDVERLRAQVAGLKLQVKRWAARAKA